MDDGRRELVQVAQTEGHLEKDSAAGVDGEGTVCVQILTEGCR